VGLLGAMARTRSCGTTGDLPTRSRCSWNVLSRWRFISASPEEA